MANDLMDRAPRATAIGSSVASLLTADGAVLSVLPQGAAPGRIVSMMGELVTVSPRPKLIGIWTYGIPDHLWRTGTGGGGDGTVGTKDGALRFTSGTVDGGIAWLESRDHPRYEVDSPFGFATATGGLPVGGAVLRFGQFTEWEGCYLSIDLDARTAAVYTRRTTGAVAPGVEDHSSGIGGATTADTLSTAVTFPAGADITYATLWDVYQQWRGVGDQKCLVNLVESGSSDRIGAAAGLWCSNPALPFRVELERAAGGDDVAVEFGCARIISHSVVEPDEYDALDLASGDVTIDNTERPILVIQAAGFLGGMPCTRDHIAQVLRMVTCDSATTVRVRRGATISNANVTWSIPQADRGLVMGVGSVTATVTGGTVVYREPLSAGEKIRATTIAHRIRPLPGTLTAGANRGDPAFGETWCVTVQKKAGGTATASAVASIGSLF